MAIGAIGALGALASIGGTVLGFVGQLKANKAAKKAERARAAQARLESRRARREAIRRSVVQRARSEAVATNQGAGDSSAATGAQQTITSLGNQNRRDISQSGELTQTIFRQNEKVASGRSLAALGSGISSFGSQLGSFFSV